MKNKASWEIDHSKSPFDLISSEDMFRTYKNVIIQIRRVLIKASITSQVFDKVMYYSYFMKTKALNYLTRIIFTFLKANQSFKQ